jgi:hypothetical protein
MVGGGRGGLIWGEDSRGSGCDTELGARSSSRWTLDQARSRPRFPVHTQRPPPPPRRHPQVRFARDRHPAGADDGRQLFFSGAPAAAGEAELRALFGGHGGAVEALTLVRDLETGQSKVGF